MTVFNVKSISRMEIDFSPEKGIFAINFIHTIWL